MNPINLIHRNSSALKVAEISLEPSSSYSVFIPNVVPPEGPIILVVPGQRSGQNAVCH
jgi:hypothetical protein